MAKVKIEELSRQALNWTVLKAEVGAQGAGVGVQDFLQAQRQGRYCFDTDWSAAGPIIEREFIRLSGRPGVWVAESFAKPMAAPESAPTALVAAMRSFVAGRFGPAVEVPDELLALSQALDRDPEQDRDQTGPSEQTWAREGLRHRSA